MKLLAPKKSKKASDRKHEDLSEVIRKINKALGAEGKVRLGVDSSPIARVPTNLLTLDYLMTGGVPRGRYVELYGDESTGKSLLSSIMVAQYQAAGEVVVAVLREEADYHWMSRLGVDTSKIVVVETAVGDAAVEAATTLIEQAKIGLVVLDSIQSFQTKREAEGSVEDESYGNGGAAQLWGRIMRRGYALANMGVDTSYVGISQGRTKIGGFSKGVPDSEPTGIKAIRHWKSISIQTKAGPAVMEAGKAGAVNVMERTFNLKIKKNKTGISGREGSYNFVYRPYDGKLFGVDYAEDAFRMGRVYEVVEGKGSWFYVNGKRIANGEAAALAAIRGDKKLLASIRGKVAEMIKGESNV